MKSVATSFPAHSLFTTEAKHKAGAFVPGHIKLGQGKCYAEGYAFD